jgi:DNA helicase-2/ATP-dependent DNA helicase PcrA
VSLLDAVEDPGELGFDPVARDRFAELAAEIRFLRRGLGDPLPDLVHRILVTTGLDVEMAASPDVLAAARSENLAAFTDLIAGFTDVERDASLGAFLSWLRLAQRFDRVPELERPSAAHAIALMTVHRSKGLEWPVVVVPSMTATIFPSTQSRKRWPSNPGVLPYPLRGDADSLPGFTDVSNPGLTAFKDQCAALERNEERRLGYVAITRAERLLIASASWWGPSQVRPRGPSEYLLTLRDACHEGAGTVVEWADTPTDDDTNPARDQHDETPWPPSVDLDSSARRRQSAESVRGQLGLTIDDLRAEYGPAAVPGDRASLSEQDLARVRSWDDDIEMLLQEQKGSGERVITLPSSLSASDLVRLAANPEAFTRDLARPMPTAPAGAARRGTRFHAWVEAHFGIRPLLEPDDLPGSSDPEIESDDDLASMQETFLRSDYADRSPIGIEVEFNLVLGGRVVPGRIDAVFATNDESGELQYEVVDWKTSRRHDSDPLQLAIYRIAYAELLGVPVDRVTAAFVYVRDGSVVRFDDLPDRTQLERLLASTD